MTIQALNAEIAAVRRRISRELGPFASVPEPETEDSARSLLSLLLRFEYHWKRRLEVARSTRRRVA